MIVQCPRCVINNRPGTTTWHATGRFGVNRYGRRRAWLVCETCGYRWASALPAALAAAADDDTEPEPEPDPLPTLRPPPGVTGLLGFAAVGDLGRAVAAEIKKRRKT